MSATGRDAEPATTGSDVAEAVRGAGFVQLVARADGDALAATGVLARGLSALETPFQATVARQFEPGVRETDADLTVAVGHATPGADLTVAGPEPASAVAHEACQTLDVPASPVLALAGAVAAGRPSGPVADAAAEAGHERRPGVALPVADRVDGLAHSTLLHGPFSGDDDDARARLEEWGVPATPTEQSAGDGDEPGDDAAGDAVTAGDDQASDDEPTGDGDPGPDAADDEGRRLASLVAIAIAGDDDAPPQAAEAIERALRPTVGGPFETVGGYADVLDALARERPGLGVALALGQETATGREGAAGEREAATREEALAAWRSHGRRAHATVREAETTRHDGLYVVRAGTGPVDPADVPVGTVARLVADYRSPEPVTLVVAAGGVGLAARDDRDAPTVLRGAVRALADRRGSPDGESGPADAAVEQRPGGPRSRARARVDPNIEVEDLVAAVREAL